ncbi:MAG: HAD family hydrolase [Candidatus Sumerlaeia bacterium]|nr:HAD family hydrolase [Candidatus Sumerlaeia bacterium]
MTTNNSPHTPTMPRSVRLVAFDLDGTLADPFKDIAEATNHALMAFGCPTLPAETIKQFVGRGVRELMARALGPDRAAFADAAVVFWREYYERHPTDHTRLYPGVVELLEWLQQANIRTAIWSNKVDALTQRICAALGLAARVDFIRGESSEFPRKPDPALLDHVINLFGVKRDSVLVVGDSLPDLELARNAGVAFCGVLTGQATREDFARWNAPWVVETLEVLHKQLRAVHEGAGGASDRAAAPAEALGKRPLVE